MGAGGMAIDWVGGDGMEAEGECTCEVAVEGVVPVDTRSSCGWWWLSCS